MFNYKNNIIYTAKKNLGQNFLINDKIIENIISSLNLKNKNNLIEIGPGYGALTKNLYNHVEKFSLIEFDKQLYLLLKKKYKNYKKIYIYNINILHINFKYLIKKKTIIIGNIPYKISLKIINHLTKYIQIIKNINIMIQSEVYKRINAKKKDNFYGKLSIIIQLNYKIINIIDINKDCFFPKPLIKSNFIKLLHKYKLKNKLLNIMHLNNIIRIFFNNKRKKINKKYIYFSLNNKKINIRAENISIYEYIKISNKYSIKK